jgi:hypothetical protein
MQQVVDLQRDKAFDDLGVQLLAISPDPVSAHKARREIEQTDRERWRGEDTLDLLSEAPVGGRRAHRWIADAGAFMSRDPEAAFVIEGSYLEEQEFEQTFERDGLSMTFSGWEYPSSPTSRYSRSPGSWSSDSGSHHCPIKPLPGMPPRGDGSASPTSCIW